MVGGAYLQFTQNYNISGDRKIQSLVTIFPTINVAKIYLRQKIRNGRICKLGEGGGGEGGDRSAKFGQICNLFYNIYLR